ncbi:MAG: hypothetical protein GY938_12995 [Ketobacter sp.]|nr:hypothetical protein [Ketobacter sp.]
MQGQYEFFSRLASENGDGTGEVDAILDYSTNPMEFIVRPSTHVIMITRLLFGLRFSGNPQSDTYGGVSLSGSEGMSILVRGDWGSFPLTSYNIQDIGDMKYQFFDFEPLEGAAGDNVYAGRYTPQKMKVKPNAPWDSLIYLYPDLNDELVIIWDGDFSSGSLIRNRVTVQGRVHNAVGEDGVSP